MFTLKLSGRMWKVVGHAIDGWGSTIRLVVLMVAATTCLVLAVVVVA